MIDVLFVCLGNICRSPLAEVLFEHKVKEAGLEQTIRVDSAGTGGWHVGELPDPRSREVAAKHGIVLSSRSRKLREQDLQDFHYLIVMDDSNLRDVKSIARHRKWVRAKIVKMRHFDTLAPDADVPDPYYGSSQEFEEMYETLDRSTEALLQHIRTEAGI